MMSYKKHAEFRGQNKHAVQSRAMQESIFKGAMHLFIPVHSEHYLEDILASKNDPETKPVSQFKVMNKCIQNNHKKARIREFNQSAATTKFQQVKYICNMQTLFSLTGNSQHLIKVDIDG